jgi:hypothetical protein
MSYCIYTFGSLPSLPKDRARLLKCLSTQYIQPGLRCHHLVRDTIAHHISLADLREECDAVQRPAARELDIEAIGIAGTGDRLPIDRHRPGPSQLEHHLRERAPLHFIVGAGKCWSASSHENGLPSLLPLSL